MITTKHKVFLSPSDQTKNTYAVGNTSEDVQCGRIALAAKAALERCGFEVGLLQYATMAEKCAASDAMGAELIDVILVGRMELYSMAMNGKYDARQFGGVRSVLSRSYLKEEIDEDLGVVEEDVYCDDDGDDCDCCDCCDCEDDDCDCCDCDCDCDCECFEIECPACGETVCFDSTIDPEDLACPACGAKIND